LLCAQAFLDRHRIKRAALDRGIVGRDEALHTVDAPDAGNERGAGRFVVVHLPGRQRRQFEEVTARVNQLLDAFAGKQLATAAETFLGGRAAALPDKFQTLVQLFALRQHSGIVGLEFFAVGFDFRLNQHKGFIRRKITSANFRESACGRWPFPGEWLLRQASGCARSRISSLPLTTTVSTSLLLVA
jgi:hypothetical protein